MTEAEYLEFEEMCAIAEDQEHMQYLIELVAAQTIKLEEQRVYIAVLNQLESDRRQKIEQLQNTIDELERELLKCR